MIKQAVISAGGFGTRFKPYTDTMPKPMIPVLGKPMLEWSIEQFKKHGIMEFLITLHCLPHAIMDYFGDGSKFGVRIEYFIEEQPLGEAGAIKKCSPRLDQTFYYIYGDILSLIDYTQMTKAYEEKAAIDPKMVGMERVGRKHGYANDDMVELDTNGRFAIMRLRPHAQAYPDAHSTLGAFILDKKIFSYIRDNEPTKLNRQIIPAAMDDGNHFYGYTSDEYSRGIDDAERLRNVEEYLIEHHITPPSAG